MNDVLESVFGIAMNGVLKVVYQFGLINRVIQALYFSLFTPHCTAKQN